MCYWPVGSVRVYFSGRLVYLGQGVQLGFTCLGHSKNVFTTLVSNLHYITHI